VIILALTALSLIVIYQSIIAAHQEEIKIMRAIGLTKKTILLAYIVVPL
jgi:ABC-type antimicrobial peptide transport system permease subunit